MEKLPLSSVRAFAVVARLLSISRAAEELNVTPSAVSHQMRLLETYLGATLLRRERNKITLTPAGEQYRAQISEAMMMLSHATKNIKAAAGQQIVRVAAPTSLAALWLMPRIARFMEQHRDIGIAVTATRQPARLLQGACDIGVWYGSGGLPGLTVDPLSINCVFPICTRALAGGEGKLHSPADLARYTLIDSFDEDSYEQRDIPRTSWHGWMRATAIPHEPGVRHLNFTPRILMHSAVIAGVGVGLSNSLLAVDALTSRQLVIPFGPAVAEAATYNLIYPPDVAKRKHIATFRSWLMASAEASHQKVSRMLKALRRVRRSPG